MINVYRVTVEGSYLFPSIALTNASDFLSKDNAARGIVAQMDSLGRLPAQRDHDFGYLPQTQVAEVVAAGNLDPQAVLALWKSSFTDNQVLLDHRWKVAGVAHTFDHTTNRWYWVVDFAAFWDKTIPLPGEDDDGVIDGNPSIRTRPPAADIAAGHTFTGYGDDGQDYSVLHCDKVTNECWKDPPQQGNPSLDLPSSAVFLSGSWHVQNTISAAGVVHYNDPNGYDGTGFTMNLNIRPDGTWSAQGYRAYQVPTPNFSGTWSAVHDDARNEEIVTFTGVGVTLRVHASSGVITLFAVGGASFFQPVPADGNDRDDPQILLLPGFSFFNAPHAPFVSRGPLEK